MPDDATMRAWVLHGAGDLRLDEVARPVPGPGEVLVKVRVAGICGTDLHYFRHGRCGNFVPTRPFSLGHECAGEIAASADALRAMAGQGGEGTTAPAVGTRVAVDPSQPCGRCRLCREGRYNLCPEMGYFGTASVDPPRDGCFAEYITAPAANCFPLAEGFGFGVAALLEPMSVAAHAVQRGGGVAGKSVMVIGGGTMGQTILMAAIASGAGRVVVTDLQPSAREFAERHGATAALDPAADRFGGQLEALEPDGFEVVFEAAGAPAALDQAIRFAARGATVVQVGTLTDGVAFPANRLLSRELQYVGSWRFANVFERVMDLVVTGRIDPSPLITHRFGFENLPEAMRVAGGGEESIKVQIEMP